jgi:hypothetical protein
MLLAAIARIRDESGPPRIPEAAAPPELLASHPRQPAISHDLTADDAQLAARLRGELGKLVLALDPVPGEAAKNGAVATLDAAESVIGVELLRGNPERLPKVMPSFVFLLAVQVTGQDRALELAERLTELIEQESL